MVVVGWPATVDAKNKVWIVPAWTVPAALSITVILALALRLHGLDVNSLSHPEIYVPGIPLPPGISEPPPRLTLAQVLDFHFHTEPHPIGWYFGMFLWTKLAGTSVWALRFPSVLFGTAAVAAIFLLGRQVFGSAVGLLAAAMLALHGYHLFESQNARMYVAGALWSTLTIWLAVRISRENAPRPGLEAAYVLAAVAGTQTTELAWVILIFQAIWAALYLCDARGIPASALVRRGPLPIPRLIGLQSVAIILSSPEFLHAVYRGRGGAAEAPTTDFLREYLSFGFLYGYDKDAQSGFDPSVPWLFNIALAACFLLVAGARKRATALPPAASMEPLPRWLAPVLATVACIAMLWLAGIAQRRQWALFIAALLPLLALALPRIAFGTRMVLTRMLPSAADALRRADRETALLAILAVAAPLFLFAASFKVSVLGARAFLVFLPPMLVLIAAGVVRAFSAPWARGTLIAAILAFFALSVPYNSGRMQSPRDYKALAGLMRAEMRPGDVVFVRKRNWADTPMFYYLPDAAYIADDFTAAVNRPSPRIWLITWPGRNGVAKLDAEQRKVAGLRLVRTLDARLARAELYVPAGSP